MHQIENEFLRVKIREYGAELTSVFDKKNNIEHLWNADEKFWGWHAPVLFPVVGRCLNDTILVDGAEYKMEKHGFARKSNFKLMELSESKAVFVLKSDETTLKMFPFQFEFLIGYHLKGNQLECSYEVINIDTKPMFFQLGGHPAFTVPFLPEEDYEDYYIEFENAEDSERAHINNDGFFDGRRTLILDNSNCFQLEKDMFNDDAFIFKDLVSRTVTVRSANHTHYLSVHFSDFSYLGFWAKVNAPYLCIEPWLGCADTAGEEVEFSAKERITALEEGERFNASFSIEVG